MNKHKWKICKVIWSKEKESINNMNYISYVIYVLLEYIYIHIVIVCLNLVPIVKYEIHKLKIG